MHHKRYSVFEIQEIIEAKAIIGSPQAGICALAYDSRRLNVVSETLFFALKGMRDGHDFINEVYSEGVKSFVISTSTFPTHSYPDANFFIVNNTLEALQKLATHHRRLFAIPVIGITGSNGKTIVKEWLHQLLGVKKNIVRSPKSYNSKIGVPLSVWEMNDDHELGIFEAGISRLGEMQDLASIIQPSIGILTNVREAHNEGFPSRDIKIEEKLKLFEDSELFIYSPRYLKEFNGKIPGRQKFTWGQEPNVDLEVKAIEPAEHTTSIRAVYLNEEISCEIPFTDAASIENAVCCWATILALGYSPHDAELQLRRLHPVRMRLELKNGINNCSIVDDSYSSDISSLSIALDFLNQQNQNNKRTLILSDIPQAGVNEELLYQQVAQLLENKQVDKLIGVGAEINKHSGKFALEKYFFPDTAALLNQLPALHFQAESILLKGARVFEFERISKALTQKVHETVLEINLNALEHNLNFYKSHLNPGTKLMAMVKAFSYGSGSYEIANLLQFNRVDYLAVAYADEGVTLRNGGITLPIMVMNPDEMAFETMVNHALEPEIYSFRILEDFTELARKKGITNYPVHLKLDTGMHRLGFQPSEVPRLTDELASNEFLKIKSTFSHLVGSEDPAADEFTRLQISIFEEATIRLEKVLGYSFIKHLCNTAGISRWPEAHLDMVRLGIGLYGFDSSNKSKKNPLQTVTTLKTSISQIKKLAPGDSVGYNRKGVLPNGGTVATVKIGYADGYSRKLGNGNGRMLVNGNIVPTIGNICMDMCMLDITGIQADEGDEVIVFNDIITVEEIARQMDTIPYEVFTGISERVKRVYYYE